MDRFRKLPADERRLAFQQTEAQTGLQAVSVEKDFWVCWTLRELFGLAGLGEHLTFKGGTSLSKGFGLIKRFSEDIDIIVDKDLLGFGGAASPAQAPSKKKARERCEALKETCREWVQKILRPALEAKLANALAGEVWKLEIDPDAADGQCLLFHYPAVYRPGETGYVNPVVKIELGARSDDWPSETKSIQSYVLESFPALDPEAAPFPVAVLTAERTFWEKACLLHEEAHRPQDRATAARMARHYYDLWSLLVAGVGESALADMALFLAVVRHREIYFRWSWMDYGTTSLEPFN